MTEPRKPKERASRPLMEVVTIVLVGIVLLGLVIEILRAMI